MVSSLRKGSRWRRSVEALLNDHGFVTEPRGLGYPGDDISASRPGLELSVEAKDHQRWAPGSWVDQAVGNCPASAYPVVVAHRRGRASASEAFVIMRGEDFARMMSR